MNACIVSVGDELLSGIVDNTNATYIASILQDYGISTKCTLTVGDNDKDITYALDTAKKLADVVFVTGGLGPTHDDITKSVVAKYFSAQLVFHEEVLQKIRNRFKNRGLKMPDVSIDQAYLPDNADIIPNSIGTAQGMRFEEDDTIFYVLPGVPFEMKEMFERTISNELQNMSLEKMNTRIIHTTDAPESVIFSKLKGWIKEHDKIQISILPQLADIDILLKESPSSSEDDLENAVVEIDAILGNLIYGYDDDTLEKVVGSLLQKRKKTLAVAESCTGGLVGHRITNVSGSSSYFKIGVVTYSNESKSKILGVKEKTLEKYGAVSKETAKEMAEGICRVSGCDIGLSTTGIAGPLGGSVMKPIGVVYIGLSMNGFSKSYHFRFDQDRETNKILFSQSALNLLRLVLTNYGWDKF